MLILKVIEKTVFLFNQTIRGGFFLKYYLVLKKVLLGGKLTLQMIL